MTSQTGNLRESTLKALIWRFFERAGNQIIQLVVQIALARLLDPADFGLLAIMAVFVNVGGVLVQSGLSTSLIQSEGADEVDFTSVFWVCLSIASVLYILIFVSADWVAGFYDSPQLAWPLRVLCLILVIGAFNAVQVAKASREMNFRVIFLATMASVAASGVLGIGLAVAGSGVWALVVQQLAYSLVNVAVLFAIVDWRPSLVFSAAKARSHFSFGWKLLASSLLETVYQSMSDLIIGKQFAPSELGLVTQGKKYPQALGGMLDGTIQPVMLSAVSRTQGDTAYVKRLVRRALKTSTFLVVPSMTVFAIVAEPLVVILLGEQWLPCVPYLQLYCFTFALLPISTTNLQAINGMGRSDVFLKLEIVKKAYGFALLLFTAFYLKSVMAIVAGYLIGGLIGCLVNAWPSKAIIGYSLAEQAKDIFPSVGLSFAAAVAASFVGFLPLPGFLMIVVQVSVMGVAYFLLALVFGVEEMRYLLDQMKRALNGRFR